MLLIALLFGAALARTTEYDTKWAPLKHGQKWKLFKTEFKKEYANKRVEARYFNQFVANVKHIEEHNKKNLSYWFGINQFADLNADEFKNATACGMAGWPEADKLPRHREADKRGLADSIDWVAQGKVSAVKNQGQCGSCWAFSTTGAMETAYAIKHRTSPPSLSEQELVDCAPRPNSGCNGGSMYYAFQFAEQGLCSESAYPYRAQTLSSECRSMSQGCTAQVYSTGPHSVSPNSMTSLMSAVNQGAVSVAIEADQRSFQMYSGGVFTGSCGTRLDHGVLVVGYGSDSRAGGDYWKVKNSWGASWGEEGYIRLCRNCNVNRGAGQCGILEQPVYPGVQ